MSRVVRRLMIGVLAVSAWIGGAGPAFAEPPQFDGVTTLQVPGTVVGWPLTRGGAFYNIVVHHGHGQIYPTPDGYGYEFQWINLSTGASGVITDLTPGRDAVTTGPGQILVTVTARLPGLYDVYGTPSVGTFYVTP
ncbi:hypothetical protein [Rhodococcus sp. NCIMB 12038]|uniref:hypothetical protein n=1 Tax=Rhodococcus sp. NCIMB 12038 TaxID=933800 RepID=UPI001179E40A|nr:hypothetical protein [Rhodococcus sp. NCIMB 12038]